MRSGRVVLLTGLLLVVGCNKGKSLIEEARRQHDSGSLDAAIATLAQVQQKAPGTPEVAQAAGLAVEWLVAASDAAPAKTPGREQRAKEALSFDPQSGAVQARVCRAAREAEDWDALRTCLDKDSRRQTRHSLRGRDTTQQRPGCARRRRSGQAEGAR